MSTLEEKIDDYMLNKISLEEIEGVTDIHYHHFGNILSFTINNHLVEIAAFDTRDNEPLADIQVDGEPFVTNYFDSDSVVCRKYFSNNITENDYYGLPDEEIDETKNYNISENLLDLIIESDKPYHADEYLQAYNAGEISDLTKQLEEKLSAPKEPLVFGSMTSIYINQDATYTEKYGDEFWRYNFPVTSTFIKGLSESAAKTLIYYDREGFKDPIYQKAKEIVGKYDSDAMIVEAAKLYEQQIRDFVDAKALEQNDHSKFMLEYDDGPTKNVQFFNIGDYEDAEEIYNELPNESHAKLSLVDENYELEEYDINIVDEDPDATDDFEDVDIE